MTQFVFDQTPSDQLVQIEGADTVVFHGGSASAAAVTFGMTMNGISTVNITFGGHTVQFDSGAIIASANLNMIFDDGSHLLIGGPRPEMFDGGPGNDALFGGDGADTLQGFGGDNLLQGNQGDDVLIADAGADTIYGGQGDDMIITGVGTDMSMPGGMGMGMGMGSEAGDFAEGNKGNDTITGGAGSDTLLGGQGNDLVQGGAGNDFISGDRGDDTLIGGSGADIFHAVADGGTDRVLDFNVAEGDRVQVDPGTMFQVMQMGADTVITLMGGGQMVLVGVNMASLHGDWIFGA